MAIGLVLEVSGSASLPWEAFAIAAGLLSCQLQSCSAEEETEARWAWEKQLLRMPVQWA